MAHFFEKRDRWGNGIALWVLAGLVFAIPVCIWSVRRIQMDDSPERWISSDNPQALASQWYRKYFPEEDIVLVTWEGSYLADPRVKTLVEAIEGKPDADGIRRDGLKQIKKVRTPQELLGQLAKTDLPQVEAIRRLQGTLLGTGSIKVRLSQAGRSEREQTIERLKMAAESKLGHSVQITEAGLVPDGAIAVPLAASTVKTDTVTATDGAENSALTPEHDLQVSCKGQLWSTLELASFRQVSKDLRSNATAEKPEGELLIEECFLIPGSPIGLALILSEAGLADRGETLRLVKERALVAGIPEEKLHLGGAPVAGAAFNAEALRSLWNKSAPLHKLHERSVVLVASLVGIVLSIWMLRSLRLVAMVLTISYLCVLFGLAVIPATGGSLNMVLVVLPTLFLVITLSGAIHLANAWKQAAAINPRTAAVEALRNAQAPCLWAGIAMALGLASLMASPVAPIREFGFYSSIGTGISLALVLLGLPSLLQIMPGPAPHAVELDNTDWINLGSVLTRFPKTVVGTMLVLGIGCAAGLICTKSENRGIRSFASHSRIVQDYNYIEANLAGISPVELIVRFDQDAQEELRFLDRVAVVRRIETEMGKLADISGTLSVAKFLPEIAPLGVKATKPQKIKFSSKSREIEENVKNGSIEAAKTLYAMAPDNTPFNAAGDELWRITAQVSHLSAKPFAELTTELDDICRNVLKDVTVHGAEKYRPSNEQVHYHPGASHIVAGGLPYALATQQELQQSLIGTLIVLYLATSTIVLAFLKNPLASTIAMVPIVLPAAMVFGGVAWAGVTVEASTLITALVAVGLGLLSTLHLIHRFRLEIAQGKSQAEAATQALAHCGPPMWQTGFIISVGMLTLLPSDLILISRFGWLMSALVMTTLVVDLILTPALLAGPLGRMIIGPVAAEEVSAIEKGAEGTAHSLVHTGKGTVSVVNGGSDTSIMPRPHLESASVMRVRRVE